MGCFLMIMGFILLASDETKVVGAIILAGGVIAAAIEDKK